MFWHMLSASCAAGLFVVMYAVQKAVDQPASCTVSDSNQTTPTAIARLRSISALVLLLARSQTGLTGLQGGQLTPVDLIVEEHFHRAAPGGMGGTKAAGNYSPVSSHTCCCFEPLLTELTVPDSKCTMGSVLQYAS